MVWSGWRVWTLVVAMPGAIFSARWTCSEWSWDRSMRAVPERVMGFFGMDGSKGSVGRDFPPLSRRSPSAILLFWPREDV
jgi:hypothetical protein